MRDSLFAMGARPLARRGGERSNERDSAKRRRYDRELRDPLARQAALKINQIPVELCSARRRRLLERYPILETLLGAELITLTRGGRPWDQVEWEESTGSADQMELLSTLGLDCELRGRGLLGEEDLRVRVFIPTPYFKGFMDKYEDCGGV